MLLKQIAYFQAVIETGSFYQAAKKCNVSQSAISQQIIKLEEELGEQTWFDSTINRIPLVRNGEPVRKTYCAFWRKDNSGYYVEEFAALLKAIF